VYDRSAASYDQSVLVSVADLRQRYEDLTERDFASRMLARALGTGDPDPAILRVRDTARPLTPAEHSERIAAGAGLARYYRHPAHVHFALQAGATWPEIAAALGVTIDQARDDYQTWADRQRELNRDLGGKFGIGPDEYAMAIRLSGPAAPPEPVSLTGGARLASRQETVEGISLDGVFIPQDDLAELSDSTSAVVLSPDVGRVLAARGLAAQEPGGSWRPTAELAPLLDEYYAARAAETGFEPGG
jgi:hypothetical protein